MHRYFSVIFLCLLAGCSVKKDMDEVKEATTEMRDTTNRLEGKTDDVADHIGMVYEDGREGGSINLMRESFDQFLKGGRKNVVRKIEYATIYFASMEYQLWKGRRSDTDEKRALLMAKAADLFFAEIDDLIDEDYPISVFNVYSSAFDRWLNLSVLAMAMDRLHDGQIALSRRYGFKPYSMLEIIQEGLSFRAAANRGESIPDFARKVLQREEQAEYLLQLRHNFFPLMVLGLMTDFDESVWDMGRRIFAPWSLDLRRANGEQLAQWVDFLTRAEVGRRDLLVLGYKPKTNPWVKSAFNHIQAIHWPLSESQIMQHNAWIQLKSLLVEVGGARTQVVNGQRSRGGL